MTSSAEFSGIICPSITITKDDGDIDYERWGQHLDHLIEAGINGVLVFGSIGEFYAFPLDVKKHAVDFVAKHVAGRIPVIAGTGSNDTRHAVELSKNAEKAGADALLVAFMLNHVR